MENSKVQIVNSDSRLANHIIALGGSAGSITALQTFFTHELNTELTYIVQIHSMPDGMTLLSEVLSNCTELPIMAVTQGCELRQGHIYLTDSYHQYEINKTFIKIIKSHKTALTNSIDHLFEQLATQFNSKVTAIILSGAGDDGARGAMSIKQHGGIVAVQHADDAKFQQMPKATMLENLPDIIAPASKLYNEVTNLMQHQDSDFGNISKADLQAALNYIFELLQTSTGQNFADYRRSTVKRRIKRRMLLTKQNSLQSYLSLLTENQTERAQLMAELLIGVTEFFRDQPVWQYLGKTLLPELLMTKLTSKKLRIWVAGCSTGEEVYSFAFLLHDLKQKYPKFKDVQCQLFATDIDINAIQKARQGRFFEKSLKQLNKAQINRYFDKEGDLYKVKKTIRDNIIFAPHNILSDPPFTQIDLLSCRNVLIYFSKTTSLQLLQKFHYSLNKNGYLLLGNSESIDEMSDNFQQIKPSIALFQQHGVLSNSVQLYFNQQFGAGITAECLNKAQENKVMDKNNNLNLQQLLEDSAHSGFVRAAVLVNDIGQILHINGNIAEFIAPEQGKPNWSLTSVINPKLKQTVNNLFYQCQQNKLPTQAIFQYDEKTKHHLLIRVSPCAQTNNNLDCFAISFELIETDAVLPVVDDSVLQQKQAATQQDLQQSLAKAQQQVIELKNDMQTSREELMSTNEELQSTNEELTTSSEELRTMNEELHAARLQAEMSLAKYTDLFDSAPVGYFTLDEKGKIIQANIAAKKLLTQTDDDQIGSQFSLYVIEKQRSTFTEALNSVFTNKQATELELSIWQDVTEQKRLRINLSPPNEQHQVRLIALDITEQYQYAHRLAIQEQRLRAIFDHSLDMIYVVKLGQYGDFYFESANATFLTHILGVEKKQHASLLHALQGQDISLITNMPIKLSHDDFYYQALQHRQAHTQEVVFNHNKKQWFIELTTEVILNNQQLPSQIICTLHDVSEVKAKQQQLKDSEARYARVLAGSNDGLWEWNIKLDQTYISDKFCELLGYKPNEITENRDIFYSRLHPEDKSKFKALIKSHIEHNTEFNMELRLKTKSGTWRWFQVKAQLVPNNHNQPDLLSGTLRDIHQRKLLELQDKAKNHILELTAKNTALGTILTEIITMLEQDHPDMICSFLLLDDSNTRLVSCVGPKLPDFYINAIDGVQIGNNVGSCGTAAFRKQRVIVENIQTDPLWHDFKALAAQAGLAACWSEPVINAKGKVLGTFAIYHKEPKYPSELDLQLIQQQAVLAEIAIEHAKAQEKLEMASLVFEHSMEASMVFDANDIVVSVNPAFTQITGYSADDIIGQSRTILHAKSQSEEFYRDKLRHLKESGCWSGETKGQHKDGTEFFLWMTINTIYNELGHVDKRVALFFDITEQKKSQELIWQHANFDALTKLPNRRLFFENLSLNINHADRDKKKLAVMLIDLDNFKEVNDTYGHDHGDELLIEASNRIKSCIRRSDTVSRLGGDEFTVIISDITQQKSVEKVAVNILNQLQKPFNILNHQVVVGGSIGIAIYPDDAIQAEHLLKYADQAMYKAKDEGKNRFSYFTVEMQLQAQRRIIMLNDLRNAIHNQEFELYFQPIIDGKTHQVVKAEALIRWHHPKHGMISPAEFIPLAEDSGLIVEITDWVVKNATQYLANWQNDIAEHLAIALNFSPKLFTTCPEKIEHWVDLIQKSVNAHTITIEITESLLLDATSVIKRIMAHFEQHNIKLALDDFGTGYSALAYLKKFKLDFLKIDQAFVKDMEQDKDDLALCQAIIAMAHQLGIKVIAEGVEKSQHIELLSQYHCDYLQGYHIARPLPHDEFYAFVTKTNKTK